jgi:hypothetical protein
MCIYQHVLMCPHVCPVSLNVLYSICETYALGEEVVADASGDPCRDVSFLPH